MITAHAPAGYITGRYLPPRPGVMAAAIVGAVIPDLDLLWVWFIDHGKVHHHRYWPHIPLVWVMIALIVLPALRLLRPSLLPVAIAFLAGIFGHILLDSVAGDILWGWPWSNEFFSLIHVPNRGSHWIWNFVLHPVFLAEIAIWVWATALWWRGRQP